MPGFLFDTDHLTLLDHKHAQVTARFVAEPLRTVGLCAVSIEEALRGRLAPLARSLSGPAHVKAYDWLVNSLDLFQQFRVVDFNIACDNLFQQLRRQRLGVGTQDLKIGAVALTHNLTVVTCNRRDFTRIPGLTLDDWSV